MFEMANRKAVMKDTKIDVTTENQVFLNSSIFSNFLWFQMYIIKILNLIDLIIYVLVQKETFFHIHTAFAKEERGIFT